MSDKAIVVDRRANAIAAVRDYELSLSRVGEAWVRVDEAKDLGSTPEMIYAFQRHEQALDRMKHAKERLIGCLTLIGKKITVDGIHYKSIPSRREIRRTLIRRHSPKDRKP